MCAEHLYYRCIELGQAPSRSDRRRMCATRALQLRLRLLNRHGILHGDAHLGNVLVWDGDAVLLDHHLERLIAETGTIPDVDQIQLNLLLVQYVQLMSILNLTYQRMN